MTVTRPTFTSLTSRDAFIARHIGPSSENQLAMLSVLNRATLDSLIETSSRRASTLTRRSTCHRPGVSPKYWR